MITCVSLTGADDEVKHDDLLDLTERFDELVQPEWGVLYFPEKEGTQRNPSAAWRAALLDYQLPLVAAHLCGEKVYRDILAGDHGRLRDLRQYGRLQLNINARKRLFTDAEVVEVYQRLLDDGAAIILQYHDGSASLIQDFLDEKTDQLDQCAVLFDASKGTGVLPSAWPEPLIANAGSVYCGYAGGLGPQTLSGAHPLIRAAAGDEPYWLDMESAIRTDNQFDLAKVAAVLRSAHGPWNHNVLTQRL